jgi:hypothetical protein
MLTIEGKRLHLEKDGLALMRNYITSHVRAIQTERIKRAETWMLNRALASLEDAMQEIVRVGWEIATTHPSPAATAPRPCGKSAMFEKSSDAGCSSKLGTLEASIISEWFH